MVIWIIGMSASGKTTLGRTMMNLLKYDSKKWVFIDGDAVRHMFGEDLGHDIESRRKNAYRLSDLCKSYDESNANVVPCVLSIFHDNQKYNRDILSDYKEVYLKVNLKQLMKRDNKNLYQSAKEGKIKDVVGMDIPFVPPYAPDVIINNNTDGADFTKMAVDVLNKLSVSLPNLYPYASGDKLNFPETYQYSVYLGEIFFKHFNVSRKAAIEQLRKKAQKLEPNQGKTREEKKSKGRKDIVETENYLRIFLNNASQNQELIWKLLRRFEISRKIYSYYSLSEGKRASESYQVLINYPLFSLALIKLHKKIKNKYQKYILLNCILKLNDVVSSLVGSFSAFKECQTALDALEEENKIFMSLKKEKL